MSVEPTAPAPARPSAAAPRPARDGRIDTLRGLALLSIFVDHIPFNALSRLTPRAFGFSDAAEIFVFLAGYAAMLTYPRTFDQDGSRAGWRRIGRRCLTLWSVHALLLVGSFAIVALRGCVTAAPLPCLGPLLAAGPDGLLRALTLQGLPAYLDILPLYMLLLGAFPVLLFGLRRSVPVTLAASLALYAIAIARGWNLPSQIDSREAAMAWTFNPFTWQLVFVLGATAAAGQERGWRWLRNPPTVLTAGCVAVLVYGFAATYAGQLWPALAEGLMPRAALSDDWKCATAPWRVVHSLALLTLLLGSRRFALVADWTSLAPVKACGRFALPVFSAGCILALLGRIAFQALGMGPAVQLGVNTLGLGAQLGLAYGLQCGGIARVRAWREMPPRFVARVTSLPGVGLLGPAIRSGAAFLCGASLLLGPALAYLGTDASRQAPIRTDYAPPPHLAADGRLRIVAFGSSSTRGYGASREGATYPAQLGRMLDAAAAPGRPVAVFNRGVDGDDIRGMLARIDDDVLSRRPGLVVWQLGTNDALHDASPAGIAAQLRAGIARLRAGGATVVLIGPQWNPDPKHGTRFAAVNAAVQQAGRDLGVPTVNRYALMRRWIVSGALKAKDLIGPDGLHMTDRAYGLVARAVFETLVLEVPAVRARLAGTAPAG